MAKGLTAPRVEDDEWSFFFPGRGETIDDAIPIWGRVFDAEHAARQASEYRLHSDVEAHLDDFSIVVVSPCGEETDWVARHEPSIDHVVRPDR